jgi:hypothetical protein
LLTGEGEASMASIRQLGTIPDPEGRFYVARQLAFSGDPDTAMQLLSAAVDEGFFCLPAFVRDPWLDSLRTRDDFGHAMRRAEARHRQAIISFLTAEGDRVLGLVNPV